MSKQGADHGGTGDHQDGAEEQGQARVEIQEKARRQRRQQPTDQGPDRHQAGQDPAEVADLLELEAEAAFEHDQSHRQRNDGEHEITEQGVGIEQPEHRSREHAEEQQQQNGR